MTWYLWVFGTVATLNMAAAILIGLALFAEEWTARRRNRGQDRYTISNLTEEVAALKHKNRRLDEQLKEVTQRNNSFGRISP